MTTVARVEIVARYNLVFFSHIYDIKMHVMYVTYLIGRRNLQRDSLRRLLTTAASLCLTDIDSDQPSLSSFRILIMLSMHGYGRSIGIQHGQLGYKTD